MTESMIERVAKALNPEVFDPEVLRVYGSIWAYDERDKTLAKARAAIEAMWEPTEAMRKAVENNSDIFDAAIPWQNMIDAALQWPAGSADRAGVPLAED